jgi:DNA polymerase III epsilon subunit-like protein
MNSILLSGDVEASGQVPGHGDLISFGLVVIEPGFERTFRSPDMKPSSDKFDPGAYASIGMTREEHLAAPATLREGMLAMKEWLDVLGTERFVLVSDNPAFDFMWLAVESYNHLGYCPFGHSARRIGDAWAGIKRKKSDTRGWKKYRKTPHTHDPLDDAMGNAEAWLKIWEKADELRTQV